MLQPQIIHYPYDHLKTDIEKGLIKIPKFQRDFVWSKEKTAKLIDSMLKGFPIGTFIFWKTREQLKHIKNIGNIKLPETPHGDATSYVLDGQQRITSLYAIKKGAVIKKDGIINDYKDIVIDLSLKIGSDEEIVLTEIPKDKVWISVFRLLNGSIVEFIEEFDKEIIKKIETYQKLIVNYNFSTIVISDYPLDLACEVFTRINTTGTELTLFEIMVAKTYDPENGFDLAERYDWLIDNHGAEKDLEDANFDTIPPSTVLQCVSAYLKQQVTRKDILRLDKKAFIDSWDIVTNGVFCAVDYIRTQLRIPVSQLLPYNAILVPLAYFFIRNEGAPPANLQNKLLVKYFYWAALSSRFTSAVESKIALDITKVEKILREEIPIYEGEQLDFTFTIDKLKNKEFSAGDAVSKAILCIYVYYEPKSFKNNSIIKLDNSWLKLKTSKNYHHFFPRAYLRKNGTREEENFANSILNITIVDDYLNKREIKANAPSNYMKKFAEENPKITETMTTHLIDDLDVFGVWTNDYESFLKRRGERVLEEINKRLNPKL